MVYPNLTGRFYSVAAVSCNGVPSIKKSLNPISPSLPLDEIDSKVINALQDGFSLHESPYRLVAEQLDLTDTDLIVRIRSLLDNYALPRHI